MLAYLGHMVTAGDMRPVDFSVETSTIKALAKYFVTLSLATSKRYVA